MNPDPEINECDFGDGDIALVVELPIPPFEMVSVAAEDTSEVSRSMLEDLVRGWGHLWPDMLDRLQDSMTRYYDCDQVLGRDEFMGSICRMSPEFYMGDKSDYMLRLEFDEPPLWDFFLKDNQIIHFQSVF
jgi:hypothetical protein